MSCWQRVAHGRFRELISISRKEWFTTGGHPVIIPNIPNKGNDICNHMYIRKYNYHPKKCTATPNESSPKSDHQPDSQEVAGWLCLHILSGWQSTPKLCISKGLSKSIERSDYGLVIFPRLCLTKQTRLWHVEVSRTWQLGKKSPWRFPGCNRFQSLSLCEWLPATPNNDEDPPVFITKTVFTATRQANAIGGWVSQRKIRLDCGTKSPVQSPVFAIKKLCCSASCDSNCRERLRLQNLPRKSVEMTL